MGDGLLEGRAAKGLVARLAPPFDGEVVEPRFGEMMGDDLGLDRRALRLSNQDFGGAAGSACRRLLSRLSYAASWISACLKR